MPNYTKDLDQTTIFSIPAFRINQFCGILQVFAVSKNKQRRLGVIFCHVLSRLRCLKCPHAGTCSLCLAVFTKLLTAFCTR